MTVRDTIREAKVTTPYAVACHVFVRGECVETTIHPAATLADYERIRKAFDPWNDKNKTCNLWAGDGSVRFDSQGRQI